MRYPLLALVATVFSGVDALSSSVSRGSSRLASGHPTFDIASHPNSITKTLVLRGGITKSDVALGINAFTSTAYGLGFLFTPAKVLTLYGAGGALDFLNPVHGVAQFMGGLQLAVAVRCFGALGVTGFPTRGAQETLQDMCVVHSLAAVISAYRAYRGSGFSLLAASATPLPGCIALAALSYSASKLSNP
eukprot:CAMPEP_0119300868 /NCGR_PEP_ID=MMETSP1333-20130426/2750_1 /TAXON_ID=418940 /ORGANISM="Scyphosphaera apsteinii, Strain RCC1455" /LENGTH=189 /DNA_ID=CAMNT_0007302783 /DNA_START=166 /DNA_END=735 /DNA_ORIENTATION=-